MLTAYHAEMLHQWEKNIKDTSDTIVKFAFRSIPGVLEDKVDLDQLYDIYSGPVIQSIVADLRQHLLDLVKRRPEPLSYVRSEHFQSTSFSTDEMITLITKLVRDKSQLTVSAIDPFNESMVELPLKSSLKSLSFFDKVNRLEAFKRHVIRPKDEMTSSWISAMTATLRKFRKRDKPGRF